MGAERTDVVLPLALRMYRTARALPAAAWLSVRAGRAVPVKRHV